MAKTTEKRTEYSLRLFYTDKEPIHLLHVPPISDIKQIEDKLRNMNFDELYKIEINITDKTFDLTKQPFVRHQQIISKLSKYPGQVKSEKTTQYSFLVAKSIKTVTQLHKECKRKYKVHRFTADEGMEQSPAIITYIRTNKTIGIRMNPQPLSRINWDTTTIVDGGPTPWIDWGKDILCETLDSKKDIVIDHKLQQIFPKKTGKMPTVLERILTNGR